MSIMGMFWIYLSKYLKERRKMFSGFFSFLKMKKYDNIISLGTNCEFSAMLYKYHHFVQGHLFTWCRYFDNDKFLESLKHSDEIFTQGVEGPDYLYKCKKFDVYFHGRANWGELLDEQGNLVEGRVKEDTADLLSRIAHLKDKFKYTLADNSKKLFVIKTDASYAWVKSFIEIIDTISQKPYDILIITTKDNYDNFKELESEHVFVRTLKKFAPLEEAAVRRETDWVGWKRIFREFRPNYKMKTYKKLKFEVE